MTDTLANQYTAAVATDWVNPSPAGRMQERWLQAKCRRLLARLDKTTTPDIRMVLLHRLYSNVNRLVELRGIYALNFNDVDQAVPFRLLDFVATVGDLADDAEKAAR